MGKGKEIDLGISTVFWMLAMVGGFLMLSGGLPFFIMFILAIGGGVLFLPRTQRMLEEKEGHSFVKTMNFVGMPLLVLLSLGSCMVGVSLLSNKERTTLTRAEEAQRAAVAKASAKPTAKPTIKPTLTPAQKKQQAEKERIEKAKLAALLKQKEEAVRKQKAALAAEQAKADEARAVRQRQIADEAAAIRASQPIEKGPGEWYENGNLHKAIPSEWNRGTQANKIATLADFISGHYNDGNLNKPVSNLDDIRALAVELDSCVSGALGGLKNPPDQPHLYDNQTVNSVAAYCLITMGWIKS